MNFWKYSATGNTFVVVSLRRSPKAGTLRWAKSICDDTLGVAADGAAVIQQSSGRLSIYNADGSRAELSGNGARCAAAWWFDAHGTACVQFKTDAGTVTCRKRSGRQISVLLPPPAFEARRIPARTKHAELWAHRVKLPKLGDRGVTIYALNVGNPQCVVWSRRTPRDWPKLGEALHAHRLFPEKTNVTFASPSPAGIDLHLWERGVGVTEASGTGAAAAVVVGARLGKSDRRVRVRMEGGSMQVVWKATGEIELTSAVRLVAHGRWSEIQP